MKDYLISIIIPVYNTQKYVEKCINSVLNNTYKNIEVIIVNDGSTDKSEEVIKKCISGYDNVIYKKTKNFGVSHARNLGLKLASGEYVFFLDSDDYIRNDTFFGLIKFVNDTNSDIVCFSYEKTYNDHYVIKRSNKLDMYGCSLIENSALLTDVVPYSAAKLFKLSLIKEYDISFDEDLRIFEDLLFTFKLCKNAKKIGYVDEVYYYYNCSNESSVTHLFSEKMFDIFKSLDRLKSYYGDFCSKEIDYIFLKHICLRFFEYTKDFNMKKKYINESFDFLNKKCVNYKKNIYFRKSLKNRIKTNKFLVLLINYIKLIGK